MTPDLIAGRYQVLRPVGRGGMGTVWLCRDELLGREVAVKQIGALPGETATDAARALREARSSAALNHRNVVSVFDVVDTDDGKAWLVMEYVPSRTLGEIIRDDGPLEPQRAAWIGAQVAEGLAAAHALGTIHRDVKPGNILVGPDDVAKISDFGIARGADDTQITRTGLVIGTPSYFSPELARGEDPGPESDVYALGATLYTAVEGHNPYPEQRNPIVLLQKIAAEEPPPPSHAGPLFEAIERMMDRSTHTRWTMADAADSLRRVAERGGDAVDHTAVLAAPVGGWFAGQEEPDDDERGDRADGVVATSAGAAERSPTPPPAGSGPGPGGPDEPDRRRRGMVPWLVAAAVVLLVLLAGGYMMLSGDSTDRSPRAATRDSTSPDPSKTPSPRRTRSTTPSATPSPTPSPSATPSPQGNRQNDGQAMERFVEDYYALMPENTDAGWQRLSPAMQDRVGRGGYEQWWDSVDSVDLQQAQAVESQRQVEVVLTYYMKDGSAKQQSERISLVRANGSYLIDDDDVLSSRTVS
ncbi:MAG TPA: protein kinase [Nocardioidaceae bacterium]